MLSLLGWLQVTFTATVISASDAQLLGPSNGAVLFSVSGSNAFSYVHKTLLGSAKISRAAVSGTASLTMHKDSAGLTLLPGLPYHSLVATASSLLLSSVFGMKDQHCGFVKRCLRYCQLAKEVQMLHEGAQVHLLCWASPTLQSVRSSKWCEP